MPLRKRIAIAGLVVVAALFVQSKGFTLPNLWPASIIRDPLLVEADGFHAIVLRSDADTLSKGQAATLGSQDVEDAASANGGEYEVYWTDETPEPAHQAAINGLAPHGTPSWYICDSVTHRSKIGPVPESTEEALAAIAEVRGAAK